ncbi:MAG TPA: NAD-dependent epimerase/dehydratase family protein [Gemmatimonadaceae bacterium]|nr:NAD-dependent epimerase/dehydratase family protein [Gemmatimonadaceae bacterium]
MSGLVVVTGGAGFIGSHVADAFVARGDRVLVIDDLSSGRADQVPAGAALHALDIRSPEAAACVRGQAPELIVHLAAQMDVRKSVADPVFDADVNIGGTLNLLEAARALPRRPRIIFASTGGAIYGDGAPVPTDESAPCAPASPYGVAKLAVERYLGYYARVHGFDAMALRFSNVYGPRQDPHGEAGVVAIFCDRLLDGRPLTVYGDGRQTRDYVFVQDVVEAVLRASAAPPAPGTLSALNIGTGTETDVMTLASTLAAAAGTTPRVEHAPARAGEQRRSALRTAAAAAALGWRPATPLGEGLRRTYDWFAARRAEAAR